MSRETCHLREIAHGRFRRIRLPVGVGGKACGGVPGQVGANVCQPLRVPGKHVLHALNDVGHDQSDGGEAEHREGILTPIHLVFGVYAGEPVDEALDGAEDGIEPGTLSLNDPRHVDAHRAYSRKQYEAINCKLQPAVNGHVRTSPGRAG